MRGVYFDTTTRAVVQTFEVPDLQEGEVHTPPMGWGYLVAPEAEAHWSITKYVDENDELASFTYDQLGRRTSLTRGNGAVTNYTYDEASRLQTLAIDLASTANDRSVSFTRNLAGQITQRTAPTNLYEATSPQLAEPRTYDANALNQMTRSGQLALSYDARGNLESDGNAYVFDLENRLISVSGAVNLTYDPAGRLGKVAGSATTRYLYDGADIIAEYDNGGTLLRRYVHGPGVDEPLVWYEGTGTSSKKYLVANQLGSIVAVTDGSGALVNANRYDEYGVPDASNEGLFQYTGQIYLEEAGLYHYKARAYSPQIGRFLQPDPIGYGDGPNMYAYVGNDPVNFRDPMGLDGPSDDALCEAARSAGISDLLEELNCPRPDDGVTELPGLVSAPNCFTRPDMPRCNHAGAMTWLTSLDDDDDDDDGSGSSFIRASLAAPPAVDPCAARATPVLTVGAEFFVDPKKLMTLAAAKFLQHSFPLRRPTVREPIPRPQSTFGGDMKDAAAVAAGATELILTRMAVPAGGLNVRITGDIGVPVGKDLFGRPTTYLTLILGPRIRSDAPLDERLPVSVYPGC